MMMMKMTVMLTLSTGYGDCFHCSSSSIVPSVGADDDANDDFFNKAKAYSCFVPFACSWSMVSSSLYYSLLNLYDDDVKMARRKPCLTIGIISI